LEYLGGFRPLSPPILGRILVCLFGKIWDKNPNPSGKVLKKGALGLGNPLGPFLRIFFPKGGYIKGPPHWGENKFLRLTRGPYREKV